MIRRIIVLAALLGFVSAGRRSRAHETTSARHACSCPGTPAPCMSTDARTGAFQRTLDSRTRINGAQAIKLGPDATSTW